MVHHVEIQVLILLLIASLVGMVARRIRVPYTLALVLAGLALSFVRIEALRDVSLTPELLLSLFLPPLLFEAAYHLPFEDLRKNAAHIGSLAVGGVIFSVAATAALAYYGVRALGITSNFGWPHALLFAAVVAATDPISVLALFKELGVPKRLYQVVEGESLINDGVAVVFFAIITAVLGIATGHAGGHVELDGARAIATFTIITFVTTGLGGVLVGCAVGALGSVMTRTIDDHLIEITLTTLVAFGSFLLAESLGVNGVLSTVSAGVMMGSFGKYWGMSATTRIAVQEFWEYMGFLSNTFIFLLIGIELEPSRLWTSLPLILVGFSAMMVARAAFIYAGIPLVDRFSVPLPVAWRHILVWGGLRGSLSMVLVLGLSSDFAGRGQLIDLVFGVVALSLFVQGLTMSTLMRYLRVGGAESLASPEYERARGRAVAFRRVLERSDALYAKGLIDEVAHRRLCAWYERARDAAQAEVRRLAGSNARPEALLETTRALGVLEREAIEAVAHDGVISEHAAAELLSDLDQRLDGISRAAQGGETALLEAIEEFYALAPLHAEFEPQDELERP